MRIRNQIHRPPTGREGIALAYAVFGTFVVASMVSVMFTMAGVSDKQADIKRGQSKARLLAEGALSTVEKDLQTAL
ncbi:MAG: type II secretory pathway component PulK, partial [Planctomycetota bacterium]